MRHIVVIPEKGVAAPDLGADFRGQDAVYARAEGVAAPDLGADFRLYRM